MKTYHLPIVIERDEDGYYVSCPELQGCYSQGESYEEAMENIKIAIREWLQAEAGESGVKKVEEGIVAI